MPDHEREERRLSRRQAIAATSALGAYAFLTSCGDDEKSGAGTDAASATTPDASASADCVLTPEQTEGPFYIDNNLIRRDIRGGRSGVKLQLRLKVQDASSCKPIKGATVEIWHADAEGIYSGFDEGAGKSFLRGGQRTDSDGLAKFTTIFPGWYQGRTVHIHAKVHVKGDEVHTGQLYFSDSAADKVFRDPRYSGRGDRTTRNSQDNLYAGGGSKSRVALARSGTGYVGRLTLGVRS